MKPDDAAKLDAMMDKLCNAFADSGVPPTPFNILGCLACLTEIAIRAGVNPDRIFDTVSHAVTVTTTTESLALHRFLRRGVPHA